MIGPIGAFLPDDHADQEDGQGDSNHGGWRGEHPVGFGWFDLVELLEKLAGIVLHP